MLKLIKQQGKTNCKCISSQNHNISLSNMIFPYPQEVTNLLQYCNEQSQPSSGSTQRPSAIVPLQAGELPLAWAEADTHSPGQGTDFRSSLFPCRNSPPTATLPSKQRKANSREGEHFLQGKSFSHSPYIYRIRKALERQRKEEKWC